MPSKHRIELKEGYSALLGESANIILTRFSGLNVSELSDLRRKLSEQGVKYRVIKNRLFNLSIKENDKIEGFPYDELKGPIGVAFPGEEMPTAAKIMKEFAKENESFEIMSGVMDSAYLEKEDIEALANLPTKEQALAQIAAGLNAPATQIAMLMKQIMSSLARGINAVGEKNG